MQTLKVTIDGRIDNINQVVIPEIENSIKSNADNIEELKENSIKSNAEIENSIKSNADNIEELKENSIKSNADNIEELKKQLEEVKNTAQVQYKIIANLTHALQD